MPIIKSMHLINLHFWTYLLKGTCMWQQIIYNGCYCLFNLASPNLQIQEMYKVQAGVMVTLQGEKK